MSAHYAAAVTMPSPTVTMTSARESHESRTRSRGNTSQRPGEYLTSHLPLATYIDDIEYIPPTFLLHSAHLIRGMYMFPFYCPFATPLQCAARFLPYDASATALGRLRR